MSGIVEDPEEVCPGRNGQRIPVDGGAGFGRLKAIENIGFDDYVSRNVGDIQRGVIGIARKGELEPVAVNGRIQICGNRKAL